MVKNVTIPYKNLVTLMPYFIPILMANSILEHIKHGKHKFHLTRVESNNSHNLPSNRYLRVVELMNVKFAAVCIFLPVGCPKQLGHFH